MIGFNRIKEDCCSGSQAGLTLTELLVVSSILVVLSGLIYTTVLYESQTYSREAGRGAALADLRIWTGRMVRDIRNVGYDPRGTAAAGISSATPTDFQFTADFDDSGGISASDPKETLGYRLNGNTLQRLQGSTWRTVVSGVTNLSFSYHDFQGNQVNQNSPYTSFDDIAEVRVLITVEGESSSGSISESGRVLIRNPNRM